MEQLQKVMVVESEEYGRIEYTKCDGCENYFFPEDIMDHFIDIYPEKICMVCALRRGLVAQEKFLEYL